MVCKLAEANLAEEMLSEEKDLATSETAGDLGAKAYGDQLQLEIKQLTITKTVLEARPGWKLANIHVQAKIKQLHVQVDNFLN